MTDYGGVAETAHMGRLHLVGSIYKLQPDFFGAPPPLMLRLSTEWHYHHFKENRIWGMCGWACTVMQGDPSKVKSPDQPEAEALIEAQAEYFVEYLAVGEDEAPAKEYLFDVGRMATFPYFRAHVAMLLNGSSIVLPPLPTINIGTFRERTSLLAVIGPPPGMLGGPETEE